MTNMEEHKPYLMWDNSDKDGHAETIIDYVISWCLRCTKYPFIKNNKPILYQYCKFMLCELVDRLQDMDNSEIEDVRVWKQERYVDLWVEVDLKNAEREEKHAILIENKYYTLVHGNQLKRYRDIFDEYYRDKEEYQPNKQYLHYALISCLYHDHPHYDSLKDTASANGYTLYHLYDLTDKSLKYQESESDIFNELFIREWV